MRTLYLHIHGTSGLTHRGNHFFRRLANFVHPDLFTAGDELALIALQDAPGSAHHFRGLFESVTEEQDRFYFQWSGMLGEQAWEQAADYLKGAIESRIDAEDSVNIIILGHSHGGNVARVFSEKFTENEKVTFHIITNGTPLSAAPPLLMPVNVKTWLHFYHSKDTTAWMGSVAMHYRMASVKRRIEDLLPLSDSWPATRESLPEGWVWQSCELSLSILFDPHNKSMRAEAAKAICDIAAPILEQAIQPTEYRHTPFVKGAR